MAALLVLCHLVCTDAPTCARTLRRVASRERIVASMPNGHAGRSGFSLVEVMVALLLVVVALVALEAGAAATVRTIADAEREATAMRLAEGERERAYGSACASARGMDTTNGVRVAWSATPAQAGAAAALVSHASGAFRTRYGLHASVFDGAGPCR